MPKDNIKKYRDKIDLIDKKILRLIQERASHAVSIGKLKSKISPKSSFYKPDRETKILRNIIKSNEKGILPDIKIRAIYKELISGCLSLEEILKIAYLGPEGTHSEAAVHNQFGSQVKRMPSKTIDDVFFQVIHDEVNIGVVPVENSSEGVINTTLNCLADSEDINIIGEIYLDIDHQLAAGNKFDLKDAFAIASHPQALGQCSKWIGKNFRDINQVPMNSTAEAAKFVSNNDNCVAIVSDLAIEKYQLHCVARSIQDFKDNQTRFLVIGNFEPEIAEKNKSSFLIRTENKPGALLEVLKPFNENNVNLFRIETRPSRSDRGSHDFFIDSEGHIDEKEMQLVIKKVKDVSSFVKVLGSYPLHS